MTYSEFANKKPVLYGQIMDNGKSKIGSFQADWQAITNSVVYFYHTHEGNKGKGGFTLMKAYQLFKAGRLSTNPEKGNPNNYL